MISEQILDMPVKRVWILGDLHFGVRSNSLEWLEIQKEFFENEFIPTLEKEYKPGDVLVQVGDTFDNRQSINIKVLNYAINLFERLGKILPTHIICGNHDIWAKKTNDISSIDSLKWIPNVQVYKEPIEYKWLDKKILLMPWRRDSSHEAETLADFPSSEIVFCHSEVKGIYLNSKVKNMHGNESNIYDKYARVYSGHIHYRQEKNKLLMVGVPYQLTRSDMNNSKGFDLVDLETMEETFYENDSSPKFLRYNIKMLYDMNLGAFKEQIKNNFVDLYVPSDIASNASLSNLINKVQKIGRRIEPNIYQEENFIDKDLYDLDEIDEMQKNYSVLGLCEKYVDSSTYDSDTKKKILEKIANIYNNCTNNYDIEHENQ
jgi:ferritin/calcineurin-like phosphoesterase family protein